MRDSLIASGVVTLLFVVVTAVRVRLHLKNNTNTKRIMEGGVVISMIAVIIGIFRRYKREWK